MSEGLESESGSELPIWITAELARRLLELEEGAESELSLDLGRSVERVVRRGERLVSARGEIDRAALQPVRGEGRVFRATSQGLRLLELRGTRFAKLFPTADAPALMLDGISMHIARKDTPWRTTRAMAQAARPAGRRLLDCCSGLGYVAIHAIEAGARGVLTVEASAEVLALRRHNPWSAGLDDSRIEQRSGDIAEVLRSVPDGSFGGAVHDPPRMTRRTGDLYGRPFYRELLRVLTPGSYLLHYLGRPGITRGRLHTAGVPDRLLEAGFIDPEEIAEIQSLRVRKPR